MLYKHSNQDCPVQKTLEVIGGKWHTIILYYLSDGSKRYGELKRLLPNTSEKMLIQSLKQLEGNGLIARNAQPTIPPKVEYSLTEYGITLEPVLKSMRDWGSQAQQLRAA